MTARMADRRKDLAAIHVLAGQLGMETADKNPDCEYRAMLFTVGRVRSSADLSYEGRARVIAHLRGIARARGIKQDAPPIERAGRPTPAPDRVKMVRKIRAMLNEAGRADEYGDGMARRMFHVERYEWLQPAQLRRVIAALEYDRGRRAARDARAAEGRAV